MSDRPPESMAARTDKKSRARAYLKTISKSPMRGDAIRYAPPLPTSEVISIASGILQENLSSDRSGRYYLKCPGESMHSGGKSARRDCEFLPDGAPTLRCFHESCDSVLKELNAIIRSACGKAKVQKFTDDRARATQAAEALLIGCSMSREEAKPLLDEWARSCDPQVSPADLSAALKSAQRSFDRADPDSIGCLLHGRSMPSTLRSPQPPHGGKLSEVSAMGAAPVKSTAAARGGVGPEEPIYIGALGQLAKEARALVAAFEEDYGYRPDRILVGTKFSGTLPARLVGLPAERWGQASHSVWGSSR